MKLKRWDEVKMESSKEVEIELSGGGVGVERLG